METGVFKLYSSPSVSKLCPITTTFISSTSTSTSTSSRMRIRIINESTRNRRFTTSISATEELSSIITSDPDQVGVSWEIFVGTLAGVTPFIVAGIEFSKRIVAQKKCGVCMGSGLVKREKYYFRCPRCGGFLPWQSWKRFFSG